MKENQIEEMVETIFEDIAVEDIDYVLEEFEREAGFGDENNA